MDERALWKDEVAHLIIQRALWTDEVVVFWTNGTYSGRTGSLADKLAGLPSSDVWVWAYGLRLFDHTLAHTVFPQRGGV